MAPPKKPPPGENFPPPESGRKTVLPASPACLRRSAPPSAPAPALESHARARVPPRTPAFPLFRTRISALSPMNHAPLEPARLGVPILKRGCREKSRGSQGASLDASTVFQRHNFGCSDKIVATSGGCVILFGRKVEKLWRSFACANQRSHGEPNGTTDESDFKINGTPSHTRFLTLARCRFSALACGPGSQCMVFRPPKKGSSNPAV